MSDADDLLIKSVCFDGPWAGRMIAHARDDHEARTVTESHKEGRDRGSAVFLGVYEWSGNNWRFKPGMPVVG